MINLSRPQLSEREFAAVDRVLRCGGIAQGPEVMAFEHEFSKHLVNGWLSVAVSSGTAALQLLLLALGFGPGDEVIVPSLTFAATANAVRMVGATPVFADVDATLCLDPSAVEAAISDRTVAVMVVHLYGQPADMNALRSLTSRHGLALLEDAAQAHGACLEDRPVGTLGDGGAFSFYPTKNMTTGEGGMVVTRDPSVARGVKILRNQGMEQSNVHEVVGFNLRMTDSAAAMGRIQLQRLPEFTAARRRNAARYDAALSGIPEVTTPVVREGAFHVYNQYSIRCVDRDSMQARLAAAGVETRIYYPTPVHRQPAFGLCCELPETERACQEVLSIPAAPHVSDDDVAAVIRAIQGQA